MKTKNFFLAYLVVAVLILQNSFSQTKQTQSQSGRAISLIPKFELKLNEKGMPGALSGKSAMCEISSVVYEPKGPLEPNSFFSATVTYKATGENYFTEQTKPSAANKTAAKIIKGSKKNLVVKYTAWAQSPNEPKSADMIQYEKERQKQGNPDTSVAIGKKYDPISESGVLKMYHPSKIRKYPTTASNAGTELPDEFRIYDLDAQRFFPNAIGKWYLVKDSENNFGFVPATCVKDIKMQSQKDEESAAAKRNIKQEREIEKAKTLAIDTSEQEQWKGAPAILRRTPFEFEGGNGTAENPFLVKTAEQLNSIRFGLDFHYKLISDIDLSKWGNWIPIGGTPSYGGSHGGQGFQAADKGSGKFSGSLDGNHHVISGMTIIDHSDDIFMGEDFAERSYALFAEMIRPKDFRQAQNNFVKDLGIINYTIDVSYTKLKNGCTLNAAALSPNASSRTFENCYSSGGKIKIHASRADEQENSLFIYAGGLLSSIDHTKVINCYNTSPLIITTSDTDYIDTQRGSKRMVIAGGIARRAEYSKITGCMNSGEISVPYANWGLAALSAGIVARVGISDAPENIYNYPPESATCITSCYNIGTIRGTYVAGVMGYTRTDCYISDCYNVGELVLDEDNPQKDYMPTFKDDIVISGTLLEYGKKYVHDNGIKVVHGSRWIDSPTLGRKILKAIPEDKLGIKPSEPEAPVQIAGFTDVKSNDDFARAVPWAVENGIAEPSSKTTFSPNEPCTRGQVVEYIYRWQGSPKASGKNPFKDVKSSDTFYNAVRWASKNGFIDGKTFNGNAPCTRGDALEILYKCSGSMSMIAIDKFTDVPRSSKYQQPVSWAYYCAIAKPTTKTTFEPESVCTKGQIVTFIYQVEHTGVKDWMDTTQKNSNPKSSKKNAKSDSSQTDNALTDEDLDALLENARKQAEMLLNGNQF